MSAPLDPDGSTDTTGLRAELEALGLDLRWTWHRDASRLFEMVNGAGWTASGENPVLFLRHTDDAQLRAALADPAFVAQRDAVRDRFARTPTPRPTSIALFAAEIGIADCLPFFAGGLGAVVGEQLKTATDLGLAFTGVGLCYGESSHQWLDDAGRQLETWEPLYPADVPLTLVRNRTGIPVELAVDLPDGRALVRIWQASLGSSSMLLLDTNVPGNTAQHRAIVRRLYPSDPRTRLAEYVVLGIAGYRALEAVGAAPAVIHLNEGHTALAALARVESIARRHQLDLDAACVAAAPGIVFTTHTPVPAGHDYFPRALALEFLAPIAREMHVEPEVLLALGRYTPEDPDDTFCPTVLGLRLAGGRNGVSRLHGEVTRRMWGGLWPRVPPPEVPVGHVTNGVHVRSWTAPETEAVLRHAMGDASRAMSADRAAWESVRAVPDELLWDALTRQRARLVEHARAWLVVQAARRGRPSGTGAAEVLDPDALTVGFVGRFVAYKRPTLFLSDPARLLRLLRDDRHPLQIVFAGRAHPTDYSGKDLLQAVVAFGRAHGVSHRLVFLEDFDIAMDRWLSQGVDVWLNTPRRPDEACGIAGMKSGLNGALNLSTLDGWWDEAWQGTRPDAPPIGWVIGGVEYADPALQDRDDAESLYTTLEEQIIPAFYERDERGLPRRWLASVKESIATLGPLWSSERMVHDYLAQYYEPGIARGTRLAQRRAAGARDLGSYLTRVRAAWRDVSVGPVVIAREDEVPGATVSVHVALGTLSPADVAVQVWLDPGDASPHVVDELRTPMGQRPAAGAVSYAGTLAGDLPAGAVIAVRVVPRHVALEDPPSAGLMAWSDGVVVGERFGGTRTPVAGAVAS